MRMVLGIAVLVLGFAAGDVLAQASEIYKCQSDGGRPLYTSDKRDTEGKKCEVVSRTVTVVPAVSVPKAAAKTPSPAGFPKEDATTRATAKDRQREIIARELAQEEVILSRAKKDLAEQEATRYGDEKSQKNVLDRLQKYRENVELHEKNVQELRKELGNIK
jgi:hypothetical protein